VEVSKVSSPAVANRLYAIRTSIPIKKKKTRSRKINSFIRGTEKEVKGRVQKEAPCHGLLSEVWRRKITSS